MDIHIDVTYLVVSIFLWIYAADCIANAFNQITLSTKSADMSNKAKSNQFIYHIVRIFVFPILYITGLLTANNIVMLQYFIIFVMLNHIARILQLFKNYPDNVKTYFMYEIYINIIIYVGIVFFMIYLWAL